MTEKSRIAIVTGTSSGIGSATAKLLLDAGWEVIGISRREAPIKAKGYRHVVADLSDAGNTMAVARREIEPTLSEAAWARIGLVNNAASGGSATFLEEQEPEYLERTFALNTITPVCLMGFVARLAPKATLRICNVSSGAAVRAFPGGGDYSSSKAALRMASMAFAGELTSPDRPGGPHPDIAVISYSPGVVDTEMQVSARSHDKPWTQMFVEFHEKGMLVSPEDPGREIVEFLESDGGEAFVERRLGDGG